MTYQTREIITLQFGHYANYVGTHWWNLQEASFVYDNNEKTDINHDFLFQEGITPHKLETFTPRLLAIDTKGSLNSLAKDGTLYKVRQQVEPSAYEAAWKGSTSVIHQPNVEKNEFLQDLEKDDALHYKVHDEDKDICIDDSSNETSSIHKNVNPDKIYKLSNCVTVWSDFLRLHLHPKSIYLLDNVWHPSINTSTEDSYWTFMQGAAVVKRESTEEDITDRIRHLAECCGSLQGFQLLTDSNNGMAGIACSVAQYIADEFSSKDLISIPITPPHFNTDHLETLDLSLASIVQCYTDITGLSNMVLPLSLKDHIFTNTDSAVKLPHLNINYNNRYESSSLLASFLETITLPYRMRRSPLPLSHFVDLLTPSSLKVVTGSFALPAGLSNDQNMVEWLEARDRVEMMSMLNGCNHLEQPFTECQVIRGLDDRLPRCGISGDPIGNIGQLYETYLIDHEISPRTRNITSAYDPLKLASPFPHIFDKWINTKGFKDLSKPSNTVVSTSPSIAGIQQGGGVGQYLNKLLIASSNVKVAKLPRLLEEGIDVEVWTDITENLRCLVEKYGLTKNVNNDSDDD